MSNVAAVASAGLVGTRYRPAYVPDADGNGSCGAGDGGNTGGACISEGPSASDVHPIAIAHTHPIAVPGISRQRWIPMREEYGLAPAQASNMLCRLSVL